MSLNIASVNEKSGVVGADILVSREKLIINGSVSSNNGHPITFITDVNLSNINVTGDAVFEKPVDVEMIGVPTIPVLENRRHLGNGSYGEAIAYNPDNGLLYHASGGISGQQFFETIDRETLEVGPNMAVGASYPGSMAGREVISIAWYPPIGKFLVGTQALPRLFTLEADGSSSTLIGSLPNNYVRGFGVYGTRLFAGNADNGMLYELNPNDGSVIQQNQAVWPDGTIINGITGVAICADLCRSYVIFKDNITPGAVRSLGLVNFDTGVVQFVLALNNSMSGMVFDDVNETLWIVSGDGASVPETLFSIEGLCDDVNFAVPIHMNGQNLCDAGIVTASHLSFDTIHIPGPFASDLAALSAGVKPKGLYFDISGGRRVVYILP